MNIGYLAGSGGRMLSPFHVSDASSAHSRESRPGGDSMNRLSDSESGIAV